MKRNERDQQRNAIGAETFTPHSAEDLHKFQREHSEKSGKARALDSAKERIKTADNAGTRLCRCFEMSDRYGKVRNGQSPLCPR